MRHDRRFWGHRMLGMTATYSHGGPQRDEKLRKAVTRLDQAFRLSYGLSYDRKAVAAGTTQVPDLMYSSEDFKSRSFCLSDVNANFPRSSVIDSRSAS
jgi:hypothetical protein